MRPFSGEADSRPEREGGRSWQGGDFYTACEIPRVLIGAGATSVTVDISPRKYGVGRDKAGAEESGQSWRGIVAAGWVG